jgi:hypothetical protein
MCSHELNNGIRTELEAFLQLVSGEIQDLVEAPTRRG